MRATLQVELLGYWHAGTGKGETAGADAVVARDADDLPYLPGSHLRGLWRHAVRHLEELGALPARTQGRWSDILFGRGPKDEVGITVQPAESRFDTTEGGLRRVGDARLPEPLRKALRGRDPERTALRARLLRTLQSTAIDDDGEVKARTLRSIEVAVPMTLVAEVEVDLAAVPGGDEVLRRALGLIKAVGKTRSRGLGRAHLQWLPEGDR